MKPVRSGAPARAMSSCRSLVPTEIFAIGYALPIWHILVALRSAALLPGLLTDGRSAAEA